MLEEQNIMHQQQQQQQKQISSQQQQQQQSMQSQQQIQQHSQQQHSNTQHQNSSTTITAATTQHHHHHYHHQRAPRTPESYFNVPESIALLNIVKSDRIQSAFQSNRKNHASVWEMVADILSRYNNRKRSAKQCCNRYENLKKIYTQLKRNPEKHVRRNWPYMYLFRQIEEQRGESWGSSAKRRNELSYYQRRRALLLMNNNSDSSKDLQTELIKIQQPMIPAIATNGINNNSNINNSNNNINISSNNNINGNNNNGCIKEQQAITFIPNHFIQNEIRKCELLNKNSEIEEHRNGNSNRTIIDDLRRAFTERRNDGETGEQGLDLGARDISGNRISTVRSSTSSQINLDNFDFGGLINIKEEPTETDYEEPDRDIAFSRINNNYNGHTNLYMNGHHNSIGRNNDDINCNDDLDNDDNDETNILHPDVIVDTDHVTDSSTSNSILNNSNNTNNVRKKRKLSTSSDDDDDDSTNYELIEYLKRREKHDEKMLKRMEEREERLIKLLERTVVAIERIASHNCNNNNNSNSNSNNNNNNNNNNNISPSNITNNNK